MLFPVSFVGQPVVGSKKSRKKGKKISTLKNFTSPRNNLDIENVGIGQRPGLTPIENDFCALSSGVEIISISQISPDCQQKS